MPQNHTNQIRVAGKPLITYFRKGIILDTGPLLFFLAGNYDFDSIGRMPLTKEYKQEDFLLLQNFIKKFRKIIITPHILAEVSDIAENELDAHFLDFVNRIKKILLDSEEARIKKNEILENEQIGKFGVTDVSIILSSKTNNQFILTKDLPFALLCQSKNLPVFHFDWLRELSWSS